MNTIKTALYIVPRLDWWPNWEEVTADVKPVYCAVTGKILGSTEGGVVYQGNTLRLRFGGVDFVAVAPTLPCRFAGRDLVRGDANLTRWALEEAIDE